MSRRDLIFIALSAFSLRKPSKQKTEDSSTTRNTYGNGTYGG